MSTYKRLNKQDAYITTYTAKKSWEVESSGVAGVSGSGVTTYIATDKYLNSLQQLYYPVIKSGSIVSHSYEYYNQTTIPTQPRTLASGSVIISVPREITGTHLEQVKLSTSFDPQDIYLYVDPDYWNFATTGSYTNDTAGANGYIGVTLVDNGEGNLVVEGTQPQVIAGDIIYPHGMIVVTHPIYRIVFQGFNTKTLTWKSNHPIFTHNYHCRVKDTEYVYTFNPSRTPKIESPQYWNDGEPYLPVTGSQVPNTLPEQGDLDIQLSPYITTVGLYNDAHELVAVGKLSQPTPKPVNTDMVLLVRFDI